MGVAVLEIASLIILSRSGETQDFPVFLAGKRGTLNSRDSLGRPRLNQTQKVWRIPTVTPV